MAPATQLALVHLFTRSTIQHPRAICIPTSSELEAYARQVTGAPAGLLTQSAVGVAIGSCRVVAGTTSWADKTLVSDGTFYPSRSLTAAQRLSYYASRLPLTEVATTYRFPPTPEVTRRWALSTPPGFTFDVRAWSLLSGAPTWPESLWVDLQPHVRPARREAAKLYRHQLPYEVVQECWRRFCYALRPLAEAGRLGAVIFKFPSWFKPRPAAWEELALLAVRLPDFKVGVELTSERWFEGATCDQTLAGLEELGLGFVCRDRPGLSKPVVAATADIAFVRFCGRRQASWYPGAEPAPATGSAAEGAPPLTPDRADGKWSAGPEVPEGQSDLGWAGWWPGTWPYRYNDEELAAWAPAVRDLASGTSEVHLIMDNCWRADGVDNAGSLLRLLGR